MKIRRLSETDLARIAPLTSDEKRRALERVKAFAPRFSYNPVRRTWGDILNAETALFGAALPTPWSKIEELIRARADKGVEYDHNIEVAKSLHGHALGRGWRAKKHHIAPMDLRAIPFRVEFWLPLLVVVDERPLIPFFDPRRPSARLTAAGRRFVFSAMHEHIRAIDPDFRDVALGIFQFEETTAQGRTLRVHLDEGVPLYSYEELNDMIAETYAIWADVLADREHEQRRQAGGRRGDLI